ncbi:hypothetical protein Vretimale_9234, partial [Volvox reticuliferus]
MDFQYFCFADSDNAGVRREVRSEVRGSTQSRDDFIEQSNSSRDAQQRKQQQLQHRRRSTGIHHRRPRFIRWSNNRFNDDANCNNGFNGRAAGSYLSRAAPTPRGPSSEDDDAGKLQ